MITTINQPSSYLGRPSHPHEVRSVQSEVLGRAIELAGLPAKIQDPEERLERFMALEPEEFIEGIISVNGILLNVPRSERRICPDLQVITDENGMAKDVLPLSEDKPDMLSEVLRAAQGMESLSRAALVLCHGVNAVHPFVDGNGRVSRVLYHLMMHGYLPGGDTQLFRALGDDGNSTYNLNTGFFTKPVYSYVAQKLATHVNIRSDGYDKFLAKTNPQQREPEVILSDIEPKEREYSEIESQNIGAVLKTPMVGDIMAHLVSKDDRFNGKAGRKALQKSRRDQLGHRADTFYADDFIKNATARDIRNFWDAYRLVKKQYMGALVGGLCGKLDRDIGVAVHTRERGHIVGSLQEIGLALAPRRLTTA